MANWWHKSDGKIQNFSLIYLNLCLLGQNHTGTWGVNITIGEIPVFLGCPDVDPMHSPKIGYSSVAAVSSLYLNNLAS